MKRCNSCNTEKSKSDFGNRTASMDGLAHKCLECQRAYDKKRAMLPHRVKARKEYAKTEAGRISSVKARAKWLENSTVKRSANIIVGNAVRDGRLEKPDLCDKCGNSGRIHGHHDDYEKPLDVRWLCPKCHSQWHAENGEGKNPF